MTWATLRRDAGNVLPQLAQDIAEGVWQPGPLREVGILTYTGKKMPTAIPTVIDRVVHHAMRNVIEPILEARAFDDWVSGFRPGRSRITALRQAARHWCNGFRWVADLDVASVSAGATLDEAIDWHAAYIHDGAFLSCLRVALAAMPEPISPGSGLAPMLINLRLSQVDKYLAGLRIVRFADNYCAFARIQYEAEQAFYTISDALQQVRLYPNEQKSRIRADVNVEDLFLIGG
jgi:RNA-directed DNA polymerase